MILDYLLEDMVAFDVKADDAADAITSATKLLSDAGAVTTEYIDDVLAAYERFGAYIVLVPHVAIPHAQPSGKTNKSAISFVRLKEPVVFGHSTNDPVHYVMALAGKDEDKNIELLRDLMGFLSSETIMTGIAQVSNYKEFSLLVKEVLG